MESYEAPVVWDEREWGLKAGELQALRLRQVVRPVLGPWVVVGDARIDGRARLAALSLAGRERLPLGAVVCGEAAAWAWAGGVSPTALQARVKRVHRSPAPGDPAVVLIDALPPDADTTSVGSCLVTTPLRTALDLLATGNASPQLCRALLEGVGQWGEARPPAASLERLSARHRPLAIRGWVELTQAFR